MTRRIYYRGLTWERAAELIADGFELVGATTHSDGIVAVTVCRDLAAADNAEPTSDAADDRRGA